MKLHVATAVVGFLFAVVLSRVGFTSWDDVHAMFTFTDLRLILLFGVSVAVLAVAWALVQWRSSPHWSPRLIHKGTLAGGVLFGVGWALSGACPSIAFAQIGEGQLGAIATVGGIFIGNGLYGWVHGRWFRWSVGSCLDE